MEKNPVDKNNWEKLVRKWGGCLEDMKRFYLFIDEEINRKHLNKKFKVLKNIT